MNNVVASPSRDQVVALQDAMARLPQVSLNTGHHFADGMYCREMEWPAGVTIVGKIHKREHLFILLKGEATFSTDEGMIRVRAPMVVVGKPNTKRIGYAHEDCIVLNVHRTDSKDLDQIEIEMIEPEDLALFNSSNQVIDPQLEHK